MAVDSLERGMPRRVRSEPGSLATPQQFSAPPDGYLGLLARETSRMVIAALLRHGAMPRRHLRAQLPYISPSTLERALKRLVRAGLVAGAPMNDDRRCKAYELTPAAHELLRIAGEVATVESSVSPRVRSPEAPSLMSVLSDEAARMIPRALVDGRLASTELRSLLPELPDSTLAEHLGLLVECGLVRVCAPGARREERAYELTELASRFARVMALTARLRIRMTPHDAPWLTGDLPSFLKLLEISPALRAPRDARGVVLIQVVHGEGERGWPEIEVALERGRIAQRRPGLRHPQAAARALPLAWWNAILEEDLGAIEIDGDAALVETLIASIATAVDACPHP